MNQTYPDFELLIYDDGSKQEVTYLKELQREDKRVQYIRETKHHGLAYGLNYLIKVARGNYLARMDADDIAVRNRFEKQVQFLDENRNYSYVGSNLSLINQDDCIWGERVYPREPKREDFLSYQPYAHPALMFRRSVLDYENPYGEKGLAKRGEDYRLLMQLQAEGRRGYNLQSPLMLYRETAKAYRKRNILCQLQEVGIRWHGFKQMGFNPLVKLPYVLKPIAVWLTPNVMIYKIKRMKSVTSNG